MNTIIEKIRAEIEREREIYNDKSVREKETNPEASMYYYGKSIALYEFLSFLSDLEKECENEANKVSNEPIKSVKMREIHSERDYDEWNNERSNESYMDWYNKNLLGE